MYPVRISQCVRTVKTYGETPVVREFPVELLSVEECDCIEKHDRIQHNNGGNYHLTTYQVLHDVIDSDMSDEEYDDALAEQFKEKDKS